MIGTHLSVFCWKFRLFKRKILKINEQKRKKKYGDFTSRLGNSFGLVTGLEGVGECLY